MPMKLISNKALRDFAAVHADADQPLQDFRRTMEKGAFGNFAELKGALSTVDKVGDKCVFNIGGNKYRLIAGVDFAHARVFIKAVLTHGECDKEKWK